MEVIRNIVERELEGELKLTSTQGTGTRLELVFSENVLLGRKPQGLAEVA
jgi:hypothetical protein